MGPTPSPFQVVDLLVRPGTIAADHELLLVLQLQLLPGVAPLSGLVHRVPALRDDAFKSEAAHGLDDRWDSAGQLQA